MNNLNLKNSVIWLLAFSTYLPFKSLNAQTTPILSNPAKTKTNTATSSSIESKSISSSTNNPVTASGSSIATNKTVSGNSVVTTSTVGNSNVPYDTMINGVKYRKKTFKQQYPAQYRYE